MKAIVRAVTGAFVALGFLVSAAGAAQETVADFRLEELSSGQTVQLSSYQNKQAVLLFFWTSWCPFCLKEIRLLNDRRQGYLDKGIEILAVNAGENRNTVQRLVKNYAVGLKVLLDEDSAVTDSYQVLGVPTMVLIDKAGKLRYKGYSLPEDEMEKVSRE